MLSLLNSSIAEGTHPQRMEAEFCEEKEQRLAFQEVLHEEWEQRLAFQKCIEEQFARLMEAINK